MALGGNLVLQTANNPGTATFNLIAPPAVRSSFVAACGVGQVYYIASDAASWEIGVGTVASGSPDTLTRDTVLGNSLGTTARINFTGSVLLTNETPAERDVWASADNSSVLVGNRRLSGVAAATAASDAPRLDQVGGRYVGTYTAANGGILVPIPNATDVFQLDLRNVVMPTGDQLYIRVSIDGGASFLAGANEYGYCVSRISASPITYIGRTSFSPLTASTTPVYNISGKITLDPQYKQIKGRIDCQNEINNFDNVWETGGSVAPIILFAAVSSSVVMGRVRLIQEVF